MPKEVNLKGLILARLDNSDTDNLANFDCVSPDDDQPTAKLSRTMNEFLQNEAYAQQQFNMNTTVLLYYIGELAAYVSICTDAIRLEPSEREEEECAYPIVPAVKIARLAVDHRYSGYGFGGFLIEYVRDLCLGLSSDIGIRFVTLDAFPHRVPYYEHLGFKTNLTYAKDTRKPMVSMRSDYYVTAPAVAAFEDGETAS
jgi:GNAT superfamily N-acetyltransferase